MVACLGGRTIFAYFSNNAPPILSNGWYIPVYAAIWFVVNSSPKDCVYRVLNTRPISIIFQLLMTLINIREATHGVDLALRVFTKSVIGSILAATVLSSTESFVFSMFSKQQARELSVPTLLRNALMSAVYLVITQYPEFFSEYIDTAREFVKLVILAFVMVLVLLDCLIFGVKNDRQIDITLLTYLGKLFKFQ